MSCWAELVSVDLAEYASWLSGAYKSKSEVTQIRIPSGNTSEIDELDYIEGCPMPVVSRRVADCLSKIAREDAQLIDCSIETIDGVNKEFVSVNIISKASCLDVEKSDIKYAVDNKSISNVYNFRLRAHCLGAHNLAREALFVPMIVVSDELASELHDLAPVGMSLRPEGVKGW